MSRVRPNNVIRVSSVHLSSRFEPAFRRASLDQLLDCIYDILSQHLVHCELSQFALQVSLWYINCVFRGPQPISLSERAARASRARSARSAPSARPQRPSRWPFRVGLGVHWQSPERAKAFASRPFAQFGQGGFESMLNRFRIDSRSNPAGIDYFRS